jgi:uncharacterized protein
MKTINPRRVLQYILGNFVVTFGAILMIRSAFGPAPFDVLFVHLKLTTPLTMGIAAFVVQGSIILFVTIMRRSIKYLGSFAALLVGSIALDFWDLVVLADFYPQEFWQQTLVYLAGIYFLTLGLAITATTNLATVSFDELMYLIMDWFHTKSVVIIRFSIELSGILLGVLVGFIGGIGFGEATVASVIIALLLPFLLQQQLALLARFGLIRN